MDDSELMARRAQRRLRRQVRQEKSRGNLLERMVETRKTLPPLDPDSVPSGSFPGPRDEEVDRKLSPVDRQVNTYRSRDHMKPVADKFSEESSHDYQLHRSADNEKERNNDDKIPPVQQRLSEITLDGEPSFDRTSSSEPELINLIETDSDNPKEMRKQENCQTTRYDEKNSPARAIITKPPTWQDHSSIVECNKRMLKEEIMCDVTFLVGKNKEPVHAHSYILMSRSSKMAALIWKSTNISNKKYVFQAPQVTLNVLRDVLRYLYTDEITINKVKTATEIMAAADEFGPRSLLQKCFTYLQEEMSSDNVCVTLEEAHKRNEDEVYNRCMQFIFVNAVDVLYAKGFGKLCRKCVTNIVKSDRLNADELVVYDGLVYWGQCECTRNHQQPTEPNVRQTLGDMLFYVRFPIMDVQQFTEKMSMKNILTAKEKIELYQYFHGDAHALSDYFNTNQRKEYKVKLEIAKQIQASSNGHLTARKGQNKPKDVDKVRFYDEWGQSDKVHQLHRIIRFNGVCGPWLLKGEDAISFTCSRPILLHGVVLYGPYTGRDSYRVSLAIFDEYGKEIWNENARFGADSSIEKMYDVRLLKNIHLPMRNMFTVAVRIDNGVPTYQGVSGTSFVKGKGVDFEFHNSHRSKNGTSVSVGQIPGLLYTTL